VVVDNKYDAQTRNLFLLAYGGATTVGRILPHSRQNESEADHMGAVFAAKAGYDPARRNRLLAKDAETG